MLEVRKGLVWYLLAEVLKIDLCNFLYFGDLRLSLNFSLFELSFHLPDHRYALMRFNLLNELLKFFYFTVRFWELWLLLLVYVGCCDKPASLKGGNTLCEKYWWFIPTHLITIIHFKGINLGKTIIIDRYNYFYLLNFYALYASFVKLFTY